VETRCPYCGEDRMVEAIRTGGLAEWLCQVCARTWPQSNWRAAASLDVADTAGWSPKDGRVVA
jgi:transposase-like protein